MGWLDYETPIERELMVWTNRWTHDYDKTMLVQESLIADTGTDVIELQSQIVVDWTAYLVYSPLDEDSTDTFWSRDVLISMREFENDVKTSEEYRVSC